MKNRHSFFRSIHINNESRFSDIFSFKKIFLIVHHVLCHFQRLSGFASIKTIDYFDENMNIFIQSIVTDVMNEGNRRHGINVHLQQASVRKEYFESHFGITSIIGVAVAGVVVAGVVVAGVVVAGVVVVYVLFMVSIIFVVVTVDRMAVELFFLLRCVVVEETFAVTVFIKLL